MVIDGKNSNLLGHILIETLNNTFMNSNFGDISDYSKIEINKINSSTISIILCPKQILKDIDIQVRLSV